MNGEHGDEAARRAPAAAKLPRIDLRKLTAAGVAARREAVAVLGDALREQGGVRVEGHGAEAGEAAVLAIVADHLLEALAEYFGLDARAFVDAVGALAGSAGMVGLAAQVPRALLVLVPDAPPPLEVRGGEGGAWAAAGARAGELVVLSGGALHALTGGVVPAAMARCTGCDGLRAVAVRSGEAAPPPLAAFGGPP